MGVSNHTPDPAAGAAIDAAGVIVLPDDNESAKADNIRLGDEQLADWVSYRTGGPAGNIEFKITGNGAPPVAGYTVVTRPIIVKGLGIQMFGSPLDFGSSATITGSYSRTGFETRSGADGRTARRQSTIVVGGGGPSVVVDVSADEWLALGTLPATSLTIVLRSTTAPIPTSGEEITVSRLAVGSGNISIERENGTVIATLDGLTRSSVTVSYWPSDGGWLLSGGFQYTIGANP